MSRVNMPPSRSIFVVPAGMLVACLLLLIGGNLAGNGGFAPVVLTDAVAVPGWEQGSLLRVLSVWVAGWFTFALDPDTALVLVYVGMASLAAAVAYGALRGSDWPALPALLLLALMATHGIVLSSVTLATHELLLLLAAGTLIPAARRLEAVGDVQSIINYGLTLILLLLAGPPLAALIPLLVLAVPFREAEARQKPSVFGAMLLVAVVPTLIIMVGVIAMAAQAGLSLTVLVQPFVDAFVRANSPVALPVVLMLVAAPIGLIVIMHSVLPDRRRKVATSLLTVLLPAYLLVGNSVFAWGLAPWLPAAALLATTLGWLCATRLRHWQQWLALALLAFGNLGSWAVTSIWADPDWLAALLPLRLFGYTLG